MAALIHWQPDTTALQFLLQVTAAVASISLLGLALATFYRHHPAARHFVLLTALICGLATPALIAAFGASSVLNLATQANAAMAQTSASSFIPPRRIFDLPPSSLPFSSVPASPRPRVPASFSSPSPRLRIPASVFINSVHASNLGLLLAAVWSIGSALLSLRIARSWFRLRAIRASLHSFEKTSNSIVDALEQACRAVRPRRAPQLAVSSRVRTPIVAGIVHPVIVLPEALMTALKPVELRDVLVHELAHVVRHDQFVILLQAIAQVAYWPILPIHWLNRRLANAREEVCDNYVLVLAQQQPVVYGDTLLRVAALSQNKVAYNPSVAMLGWRGRLEERIIDLVCERRNTSIRVRPLAAATTSAFLLLTTAATSATTLAFAQAQSPKPNAAANTTRQPLDIKATKEGRNAAQNTRKNPLSFQVGLSSIPEFPYAVPFKPGETHFQAGDNITIQEIRGTAETFARSNIYWVRGTYTLSSHDSAMLCASVTAINGPGIVKDHFQPTCTILKKGTGTFTLFLLMFYDGLPHVSFYTTNDGKGFGGVYFSSPGSGPKLSIWESLGLTASEAPRAGGLQVDGVRPDSPVAQAGIRSGDILVGIDGHATKNKKDLEDILNRFQNPSQSPYRRLHFLRPKSVTQFVPMDGDVLPMPAHDFSSSDSAPKHPTWDSLGLTVSDFPARDENGRYAGSLRVDAVRPDSPAAQGDIRSGDIIVDIDGHATQHKSDLEWILDNFHRDRSPLRFRLFRPQSVTQYETIYGNVQPTPP